MQLNSTEKQILLKAAREAITANFRGESYDDPSSRQLPNLNTRSGAFVTLTKNSHLRGCIGYIQAPYNLFDTVCDAAVQAAMHDPRFPHLTEDELVKVDIEISVLYPPYDIDDYSEIELGKHGLILDEPKNRALLLPQVATEHHMDVPQFLSALCEKAWLPANEWKKRKLKLQVFSADVFSENEERKDDYA
ncbi:MAG TPA: AmmeMemoRadiSam system protein A [Ignavibacteriaceae bacterium]|nr:AmmeMemoRadiSam system protein A [Ignavibacteriaceae bacterium]